MVSLFKEKKNVDVLICGAGPVGLFLANELAEFEINFRIIEKVEKHPEFSKALLISPRTMDILDNRGLLHPFLEYGVKMKQFFIIKDVHNPSNPFKAELSNMNNNFSFALMNRQNKTVDYLIDALDEKKSTRKEHVSNVEFCMELIKYEEKDDHVIAVVKNTKDNIEEEIICQYLVGCDGVHSTVRKGINGWTFEGQTLTSSWALADVEIDHELVKYDQATTFLLNKGPIGALPLDARKNTFRLVAKIGDEKKKNETNDHVTHGLTNENHITLEELQKLVDERIAPIKLELKNPVWISNFKINERIVNRYRTGRVFIAGDAAHCHSPLGGQGMNLGIQDAHNLAFKLALVIRNQAADDKKLLDSYEHERYPVGKNVIKGTGYFTKILSGNDYFSSFLRTRVTPILFHFFPKTVYNFLNNLMQNNLHYLPVSSEILHKYKPRSGTKNKLIEAGHYVQDGLLTKITSHKSHERITMFDIFRSTALKHTLILFTLNKGVTADCNPLIETLLEIYNDYKNTITPIIISYQGIVHDADVPFMPFQEEVREQHIFVERKFELHEKYGVMKEFGQQAFVLVRPDLYIASAVFEDDVDELKAFLDQYLAKADK
ncbi:FAD binding domain-containing protein [Gigaspora margarita]|uniref:FAD binding domain-containing protein n=1 Tax=Gigaspora margarita TaxID=4874 RepID=A0A8H3X3N3_GIGMA|nr:FAD binding domain-containing protein [Gigaspora margarita]